MNDLMLGLLHKLSLGWPLVVLAVGVLVYICHRRLTQLRQRERLAREVEDALVQNAQGLILNVHGIVKELSPDDPMRERVEHALERADEQLSEDRERVQHLRMQERLEGERSEEK